MARIIGILGMSGTGKSTLQKRIKDTIGNTIIFPSLPIFLIRLGIDPKKFGLLISILNVIYNTIIIIALKPIPRLNVIIDDSIMSSLIYDFGRSRKLFRIELFLTKKLIDFKIWLNIEPYEKAFKADYRRWLKDRSIRDHYNRVTKIVASVVDYYYQPFDVIIRKNSPVFQLDGHLISI